MVKSKQAEPPVGMFASLKTPNFRRFFVGHLVSNCGNWATNIAIGLLVLERTDSGVALGILAICQYGPLLVVTPWSGLVVDRSNTRRLLLWTQILEMVQSAGLAVATVLVPDSLITFYAVALIGGCLLAFDNPARRSLINEMVDKDHIPNAVALSSTVNALSRTVGPLVAGSLITTVGYTWCFTFDAISYLVMVGALLILRDPAGRRARQLQLHRRHAALRQGGFARHGHPVHPRLRRTECRRRHRHASVRATTER